MTRYYKRHQRGDIWHYIKLMDDRIPAAAEIVNFLNTVPQIYFEEYNLFNPAEAIDYQALVDTDTPIHRIEYEDAYELATKGYFEVYIKGKKQSTN